MCFLQKNQRNRSILLCVPARCQRQKLRCNLLALQEKLASKKQPGPQVDSVIADAPVGLCTAPHCQAAQIHRTAMPSRGRMLLSQGRHNQALIQSQTAQVLWLLALNQDTLWLSHMLGKTMPVRMLETGLLLFTGCWQWRCAPHILSRPGASSKKGNYTSQKV